MGKQKKRNEKKETQETKVKKTQELDAKQEEKEELQANVSTTNNNEEIKKSEKLNENKEKVETKDAKEKAKNISDEKIDENANNIEENKDVSESKEKHKEIASSETNKKIDGSKKIENSEKKAITPAPEKAVTNIENKKEAKKTKNKKKRKIIYIVIAVLIFILAVFSVIFSLLNINNNDIVDGVSIKGINVSGMSKDEARQNIEKITTEKLLKTIKLVDGDYKVDLNPKDIEASFNVEKAVEEAYNIGRDGNIITNNYEILVAKLFKKDINLDFSLNEERLVEIINDTSLKLPGTVVQNSYYIEDDELIITKGTAGERIKTDEFKSEIYNNIEDLNVGDTELKIPTEIVEPDPIDLEKIRNEIYKEPKDAYVTKNPTEVHTHVNGVDFAISMEEAKKIIEEDKDEYIIPLKITIPDKTIADLGEEAFPDMLSTFTTRYDASNYNRSTNIELATKSINGTVIMPGEVFSYNQTIGRTTLEKGYKEGTAYVGGKVVPDVGGGICQVSSTLYNTALLANLEITERSNHLFETSYVAPSRDATVYWGSIDFKFKNTRSYPIKIVGTAKNGVVKIDLYGIKEKEEYEVVIESEVISYIPNETEYKKDSTLESGKKVVEQVGFNGCKSKGYRILKKNGVVISRTLLSTDTYSPQNKIVRVGTKKVTTNKNNTTNTTKKENATKPENKTEQ